MMPLRAVDRKGQKRKDFWGMREFYSGGHPDQARRRIFLAVCGASISLGLTQTRSILLGGMTHVFRYQIATCQRYASGKPRFPFPCAIDDFVGGFWMNGQALTWLAMVTLGATEVPCESSTAS